MSSANARLRTCSQSSKESSRSAGSSRRLTSGASSESIPDRGGKGLVIARCSSLAEPELLRHRDSIVGWSRWELVRPGSLPQVALQWRSLEISCHHQPTGNSRTIAELEAVVLAELGSHLHYFPVLAIYLALGRPLDLDSLREQLADSDARRTPNRESPFARNSSGWNCSCFRAKAVIGWRPGLGRSLDCFASNAERRPAEYRTMGFEGSKHSHPYQSLATIVAKGFRYVPWLGWAEPWTTVLLSSVVADCLVRERLRRPGRSLCHR